MREGKLRAIAVTGEHRIATLPEVPTLAEVGLPDGGLVAFIGLLGPAGLPAEVLGRLRDAFAAVLADPGVRERVEAMGSVAAAGVDVTPEGFAALLQRETTLSRQAARAAGLAPN